MRVKLYSVIMLAVVTFTACSNDEMSETQTQKGLTLSASVENLSTRASMKDESGTWKFAFETNDPVSVSNSKQQASTTPLLLCLPKGKAMPLLMAKTYWWVGYSCGQVVQDLPPRTWQNQ